MSKRLIAIGTLVIVAFAGCGPSKKQIAAQKRDASIAEMKRVKAAFGDLQIALNAGVSRQEFSQRTNDALVKIGDLQHSESLAADGLPAEKDKVAAVYVQFGHSAEIYSLSKQFFGPNPTPLGDYDLDMLSTPEYEMLQKMFPDAYGRGGYFTIASRTRTVNGLWKLAKEDTDTAGSLIDQLSTSAN